MGRPAYGAEAVSFGNLVTWLCGVGEGGLICSSMVALCYVASCARTRVAALRGLADEGRGSVGAGRGVLWWGI